MVALFRELRRVLAADGTFWLNLGDTFSSPKSGETSMVTTTRKRDAVAGLPPKNLVGIPWRTALALQDDGWILRNEIIWAKPNGMPESVTDRLACKHEQIFMFARSQRYWFDLGAVREPLSDERSESRKARNPLPGWKENSVSTPYARKGARRDSPWNANANGDSPQLFAASHPDGKNPGDVWNIATQPFPGAHFATFPQELARRCIVAGCKPGGVVLDPFSGSGTTGLVAQKNGRKYVGIDINPEYLDLSLKTRLQTGVLPL